MIRGSCRPKIFLCLLLGCCHVLPSTVVHADLNGKTCRSSVLVGDATTWNNRPRLYLSQQSVALLVARLGTVPYSSFWEQVRMRADRFTKLALPEERSGFDDNTIRAFGDRLPYLALAYLLTGDQRYLDDTKRWVQFITGMQHWASDTDIGAAHLIFGLSIVYDWLYEKFTVAERDIIREAIISHVELLYRPLVAKSIWWAKPHSLLQGHNYANVMSIAVAGIALAGEYAGTKQWLDAADKNFRAVAEVLSLDGASHEGVAYWSYGVDALLKYYLATNRYPGSSILSKIDYLKHAPTYRLYMAAPGYSGIANYSDTAPKDYQGPGYLLRAVASIYCDPSSQWLAEKIEQSRGDTNYSWLDVVWYDENVAPRSLEGSPLYYYFQNLGLLSVRSSWGEDAAWFLYKGGMPQGQRAYLKGIYAGSHIHPDGGQFSLWSSGRRLIVDDGYVFMKRTRNHNVFLFNHAGQAGEGNRWYDLRDASRWKAAATVKDAVLRDDYQYIESELGDLYPPQAGIRSWIRAVHAVDGELFVIEDTVTPKQPALAERMVHFSIQPLHTAKGYCAGDYFIQEFFDTEVKSELSEYSVPAAERNKDLGNYDGWLLTSKSLMSGPGKWLLVMVRVGDSCNESNNALISHKGHKLKIIAQHKSWVVDLVDKSVTVTTTAGAS